ncbi:hypothetical protein ES708_22750 [subsurface metagenome]
MRYRELGRTGMKVSEISFGAWAIGGGWGKVDDKESLAALHRAIDLGVNFIDTADVYGMGRSEKLIGRLCKERSENIYVATKAGRCLDPHVAAGYTIENITSSVEESLENLQVEALDLLHLQYFYLKQAGACNSLRFLLRLPLFYCVYLMPLPNPLFYILMYIIYIKVKS